LSNLANQCPEKKSTKEEGKKYREIMISNASSANKYKNPRTYNWLAELAREKGLQNK
jgi:hypothetical protein